MCARGEERNPSVTRIFRSITGVNTSSRATPPFNKGGFGENFFRLPIDKI